MSYLKKINENFKADEIDFELFSRLVAIILEENNNLQRKQESEINREEEGEGSYENRGDMQEIPLGDYDENDI